MKLSVIIPARNEASCIRSTVSKLHDVLKAEAIEHEIVVVNDNSTDDTEVVARSLADELPGLSVINNPEPHGFGLAVRKGLDNFSGDAVAIYMADDSDQPEDLVRFFRAMQQTHTDCAFGSRFIRGGQTTGYPFVKLLLNRLANSWIRILFGLRYNDVTNAFKLYRREVIEGLQPLLSRHFNITVELPLKAIVRGYTYTVVPNSWFNRRAGLSKLKIQEMGSRYLFIILYCFIERWLSRGDYHRRNHAPAGDPLPNEHCEQTES